jgi:hypothetical protein
MKAFALLVGFAIALLGAVAFFVPDLLLDISRRLATPVGLWGAAGIRVALGVLLLGIASRSRSPTGLRILGAFTFLGGLATPLVGVARAQAYIDWWSARDSVVLRIWALLAVVLGLFIAWAVTPGRYRPVPPAYSS